jgi:hypothetical protein
MNTNGWLHDGERDGCDFGTPQLGASTDRRRNVWPHARPWRQIRASGRAGLVRGYTGSVWGTVAATASGTAALAQRRRSQGDSLPWLLGSATTLRCARRVLSLEPYGPILSGAAGVLDPLIDHPSPNRSLAKAPRLILWIQVQSKTTISLRPSRSRRRYGHTPEQPNVDPLPDEAVGRFASDARTPSPAGIPSASVGVRRGRVESHVTWGPPRGRGNRPGAGGWRYRQASYPPSRFQASTPLFSSNEMAVVDRSP